MHVLIQSLQIAWQRNGDYALKLIGDLSDEQLIVQPKPKMNHPAWVFAHLNAYHPVIQSLIEGGSPDDPLNHKFGMKSQPQQDAGLYGGRQSLADAFAKGHADIEAALLAADDAALQRAIPIERWEKAFPTVGTSLAYLMIAHEATHLGQISAWRRVQGLPAV